MRFSGSALQHFDDKNRVVLPRKFRDAIGPDVLSAGLEVTIGFEGCLVIFPAARWEQVVDEFGVVHFTDADGREFERLFFELAEHVVPDKVGRILIPDRLLAEADLKGDALFIGVRDRVEVWNPERYARHRSEKRGKYEALASRFNEYLRRKDLQARAAWLTNSEGTSGEAGSPG